MASGRLSELQRKAIYSPESMTPEEQAEYKRLKEGEASGLPESITVDPNDTLSNKLNKTNGYQGPDLNIDPTSMQATPVPPPGQEQEEPEAAPAAPSVGAQQPASLSASLAGAEKTVDSIRTKGRAPVQRSEADNIIKQLEGVDKAYQDNLNAPSFDRTKLEDALNRARELRDTQTTRNDWLEVAQTLAKAVAQYGAAQSGMANEGRYGRDNSGINFGPGVNYEARNQRAGREYEQTAREQADLVNLDRQKDKDINAVEKDKYGADRTRLEDALRVARDREKQASEESIYQLREQRADAKARGADDKLLLRENLKDTQKNIEDLQAKDKNLRNAVGVVMREDLNSKSDEAARAKLDSLAANAGITSDELLRATNEANKEKPGFLSRTFSSTEELDKNKEKRAKSVYDALGTETRAKLDALIEKKKQLLRGASEPSQAQQSPVQSNNQPQQAQGGGKDPQIGKYASQYNLSYDQAKKVLVGRGYKPAE